MDTKNSALNTAIEKIMSESKHQYSHSSLFDAYQNLQNAYAELKTAHSSHQVKNDAPEKTPLLVKTDAEHMAYLLTRMPATYAVATQIFNELYNMDYPTPLESLLDLGTGTGSILWAAMENNITEVIAVDHDQKMIELAKKLASYNNNAFWGNVTWQLSYLMNKMDAEPKDIVTLSYVLIEQNDAIRNEILEQSWSLAKQVIIIIEPGTRKGYESCLSARDFFIKKGGFIAAPCSHHGVCPIKGNDWCHFSKRIDRSFWQKSFKQGVLGYEDEAYSYLIVTKIPVSRNGNKVLKPPLKKSGHIIFELCAPNNIKEAIVTKKQGNLFKLAKKAKWGQTIEV